MWATTDIVYLEAVGSTNDHAKQLARNGAVEGTTVTAARQTAGRGRQSNQWTSEPGNLYMTLILRPDVRASDSGQLSFLAAVALADTVAAVLPDQAVTLKWPNDLLLNGQKAAGILLETEAVAGKKLDWLVMGIGLNIAHAPDGAACLNALGAGVTAQEMLGVLRGRIFDLYAEWQRAGFAPIRDAWLARAAHIGQEINVRLPKENFRATFMGIDATGALHVTMPDGQERHIASGEVYTI